MVALVTTVLLVSCQQERVSESVLDDAKAYFEANCAGLVLPTIKSDGTKSSSGTEIYPDWNNVRSIMRDGKTLMEVPLITNPLVTAIIVEAHGESVMKRYATIRSYLEYEYEGDVPAKVYVASVIERGVNKAASYIDGKKSSDRFEIISDLDGCVMSNRIQYDGHEDIAKPQPVNLKNGIDGEFYGYCIANALLTKDQYYGGEDLVGDIWCQWCGMRYDSDCFGHTCPYCGYNPYEGFIYCDICGRLLFECNCPDSFYCPICHRPREFCVCDPDEIQDPVPDPHDGD